MTADSREAAGLLRRHACLTVEPAAWEQAVAADPALAEMPLLPGWAARRWPAVVRRYAPGEPRAMVPVAVSLPPSHRPRRMAISLPPAAVIEAREAALLADIDVPEAWRAARAAVLALGMTCGLRPRVFGSAMWQAATGMTYLVPGSDLDLLWPMPPTATAERLSAGLAAIEGETGVRIDGEFVGRDGAAVQWREVLSGAPELLLKTMTGVELRSRAAFLAAPACAA